MNILFANSMRGLYGGAEQTILDLAIGLRDRGHVCDLAYGTDARNAEVFSAPFRNTLPCAELASDLPAGAAGSLLTLVKEIRPDVVFIHNVVRLPHELEHTCPARTVRMVHDVGLFCPTTLGYFRHGKCSCNCPAGWRCWLDLAFLARGESKWMPVKLVSVRGKILEMRRNMGLDALLTVSDYMERRLAANGFDPARIFVVNPVRHLPEIQTVSPPAGSELLFVGTLQRGKGLDLLFRALQHLSVPFSLSIVGEGKSRARLERHCQTMGLADRVTFHGWVDNTSLGAFYERAAAVVVPTRAPESFCLIGPEAMHRGRPVVAFDVGGISSWLEHGHTGFLVPEQDLRGFARALERLLTEPGLAQRMGESGARRAREKFAFVDYVDKVEAILAGK